ncbi:hypothetical protein [Nocardia beijingensis]|uniref:hypothetical protein n=1 Tax=Nocardia beijingensis TaxID=95162 RepID=UPI003980C6CF
MPELGERFDPRNVTHSMMMSMLGGLSESERQHVQQRTRASMDAQVLNEGRPPYGYVGWTVRRTRTLIGCVRIS